MQGVRGLRWRSFEWRDHRLAMQAGLLASLLVPLLWLGNVQGCRRMLGVRPVEDVDSERCMERVQRLAAVMDFGARRYSLFPTACLARSLTVQYLLARRGIPASLRLGTRLDQGELSAHAWLEYRGLPLAEQGCPRELFTAF
jgi:hypothetical protein